MPRIFVLILDDHSCERTNYFYVFLITLYKTGIFPNNTHLDCFFCKHLFITLYDDSVRYSPANSWVQPFYLIYSSNNSSLYKGWVREVKGAKAMGRGEGLVVRPPGLVMLSSLHPGKGSLRSSGPICSRRGKWHIIESRPDRGFVYITLADTGLT